MCVRIIEKRIEPVKLTLLYYRELVSRGDHNMCVREN